MSIGDMKDESLTEALARLMAEKESLRAAAEALYFAGNWHCDRHVDEKTLWENLCDAAEIGPRQTGK
jgi:hypothetical protein